MGRISFNLDKNHLTRLLEKKSAQGHELLDLTMSNPTKAEFRYPEDEILDALGNPGSLIYEPDPSGLMVARKAIVNYYELRQHQLEPEDVLVTASTSEAYSFLFKLLTDPGDSVLVPQPSYPLFEYLASVEAVNATPYSLAYADGWVVDLHSIEKGLRPETKAILLVNPNNPTGSFLKQTDWARIKDFARSKRLPIICDEVFFDYDFGPSPHFDPVSDNSVLTFVLNGLSKTAALPQVKLSWIVLRGPEAQVKEHLQKLEIISDTYLSVGTAVQLALPCLLEIAPGIRKQIQNRLETNLSFLQEHVRNSAVGCLKVEAGWYATVRVPSVMSEKEWTLNLLEDVNLLLHPGYFYGFTTEAFLVLSLLTPPRVFQDGVSRMIEYVDKKTLLI